MAAQRVFRVAVVAWLIATIGVAQAQAQDKRVVDQLLDILRQNKQISDSQYRELKQKADDERQRDLGKVVPAPLPLATPVTVAAVPTVAPAPPPPGESLRAYFKNGFFLETADGNFKLQFGALTQVDWAITDPDQAVQKAFKINGVGTGVEFRRARLSLAGTVYKIFDYKFEYDFAEQTGGQPSFKDVYIGMSQIPYIQYLRVGHFKEPFSLEELTPDTYTTFQERATNNTFTQPTSNVSASGTDRNTGIAIYQTYFDQRLTVAAGGFRSTNNFGNGFGSDSPYDVTARLTGLPAYEVGDNLIHLGLSYSHRFRHYSPGAQETLDFASRPESHLFPANLVNTGQIPANGADIVNPEIAMVRGPLAIQAEYTWALVDESNLMCTSATACTLVNRANPTFDGGYIEASYFLTGESRASFYRTQFGHFERVIPINNFSVDGTHWGAWQVAARFSRLDLTSKSVDGGALDDITGGVNWYLNPLMKITMNYVWAHREEIGDSNIVEGRFQLAF
ncbi:MAG: porin [bacterium]